MKKYWLVPITILVLGVAIGLGLHVAVGQQTAPTETKGTKVTKTAVLDLGPLWVERSPGFGFLAARLHGLLFDPSP